MYCVKCGVKLADSEKICPLCETKVYHPDIERDKGTPLYPKNKIPKIKYGSKGINGAILFLFFIPVLIAFVSDFRVDNKLDWFGFVGGGLALSYIVVGLPLWFSKPNPVIFIPCDFVAIGLYVLYINYEKNGNWYLSFALPLILALGVIVCTATTLLHYLKKGKLYIFGGIFMATGLFMLLLEYLLSATLNLAFIGWSLYPLIVLVILGGALIFLGINRTARKIMERKLFF